jgi:PhzF family phenazine biosynthesis protein
MVQDWDNLGANRKDAAMARREFWQVDAFTAAPYCGNPAAVVFDAAGLATEAMQAITREMNLSETVFVLPPEDAAADYRVRIFTPRSELPFAGHPTLATAHAMIERGLQPKDRRTIRQQCGMGLVPVEIRDGAAGRNFVMTQGAPTHRPVPVDAGLAARMLGCAPEDVLAEHPVEVVSTGVAWMIAPLRRLTAVAALKPDLSLIETVCREHQAVGITTFAPQAAAADCAIRLRTFAPGDGIVEDPVCGSGNGSVAAYIARHLRPGESRFAYRAEQGIEILRPGTVIAEVEGSAIRIGGQAVTVIQGWLTA